MTPIACDPRCNGFGVASGAWEGERHDRFQ